jgi:hypothetical protein
MKIEKILESPSFLEYEGTSITRNEEGTYKIVHTFKNDNRTRTMTFHRVRLRYEPTLDINFSSYENLVWPFDVAAVYFDEANNCIISIEDETIERN